MSDFPFGGNIAATRKWLDQKGYQNKFDNWEADALLGLKEGDIFSKFGLPTERALYLRCLLTTAKEIRGTCFQRFSLFMDYNYALLTVAFYGIFLFP